MTLALLRKHQADEEVSIELINGLVTRCGVSLVQDKHGLTHSIQNAKISIHQRAAEPIFLGIQHKDLNLA